MGVLSKGITLSVKKAASKYLHTVHGEHNGDPVHFTLVTDSPEEITGKFLENNPTAVIGGTVILSTAGSGLNGKITNATLDMGTELSLVTEGDNIGTYIINTAETVTDTVTTAGGETNETILTNLQEIAELGNNAREKIDITVLSDSAKKSMDGLADTAQDLPFKFLYEKEQFEMLAAMEGAHEWCVTLPDGMKATFTASPSVKLASAGVSAALTYTLTLSVTSEIVFA